MSKNKKKLRLAFYVSGNASRLLKLLEKNTPIIQDMVFVMNDNPLNLKISQLLNEKKIHYFEIKFSDLSLKEKERNKYVSDILLEKLNTYCIDYCFCFGRRILIGELLNQFKDLDSLEIKRVSLHNLDIEAVQRKPAGIWCLASGACFYFDKNGIAYQEATKSEGFLILNINDKRNTE